MGSSLGGACSTEDLTPADKPVLFAHRGGKAHAPENTLKAFKLALEMSASGLETDIWLSADGQPMLSHDGVVWFGIKRRRYAKLTREQVGPDVPTLSDLYQACGTGFELSIDMKDQQSAKPIIEQARRFGAEKRLWLCHSDWSFLATLRQHTTARLINSTRMRRIKEGPERRAAKLAEAGIDGVNLPQQDWTGGLTALFHRFERLCIAWDVQHERIAKALAAMRIDAMHGDHVDRLISGTAGAG